MNEFYLIMFWERPKGYAYQVAKNGQEFVYGDVVQGSLEDLALELKDARDMVGRELPVALINKIPEQMQHKMGDKPLADIEEGEVLEYYAKLL